VRLTERPEQYQNQNQNQNQNHKKYDTFPRHISFAGIRDLIGITVIAHDNASPIANNKTALSRSLGWSRSS